MLAARRVRFDWTALPASWLPADPETATIIDVLHLLLPAGERWFCRVFAQAMEQIDDPVLRADLDGFVRQEAWHAKSHADLLAHFAATGIDTSPFTRGVERLFDDHRYEGILSPRAWLGFRVALVAAIEHYTSVLGAWILQARALDEAGADPTMLALLRWHGAEEVEHRAVAFDASRALGVGYVQRQLAFAIVVPIFVGIWVQGVRFLARRRGTRPTLRSFVRAGRRGLVPSIGFIAHATLRYLHPYFHPTREGSTASALSYLARVS